MARGVDVTVNVEHGRADADALRRAAEHTALAEGVGAGELSVTLLADVAMQELNRGYLGHDRSTDVLAFSLGENDTLLGDVYVGIEQAERQAREAGVTLEEELVRLVVHGTLHVLGWDHPDGPERLQSPMFRRQEELVREVREG